MDLRRYFDEKYNEKILFPKILVLFYNNLFSEKSKVVKLLLFLELTLILPF